MRHGRNVDLVEEVVLFGIGRMRRWAGTWTGTWAGIRTSIRLRCVRIRASGSAERTFVRKQQWLSFLVFLAVAQL